jgi:hypothetical protein
MAPGLVEAIACLSNASLPNIPRNFQPLGDLFPIKDWFVRCVDREWSQDAGSNLIT